MTDQLFPMQPIILDRNGNPRFLKNRIVSALLDHCQKTGYNLMDIGADLQEGRFHQEEYEQFSQLHGYSVSGYCGLSGVSDESALAASEVAKKLGLPDTGC